MGIGGKQALNLIRGSPMSGGTGSVNDCPELQRTGMSEDGTRVAAPAGSVSVTSGTSATVSGVTASVTIAAPIGSVSTTYSVTVSGQAGSISVTAPAGSVSAGYAVSVTGIPAAVECSAPAGHVSISALVIGSPATVLLAGVPGLVVTTATVSVPGATGRVTLRAPDGLVGVVFHAIWRDLPHKQGSAQVTSPVTFASTSGAPGNGIMIKDGRTLIGEVSNGRS